MCDDYLCFNIEITERNDKTEPVFNMIKNILAKDFIERVETEMFTDIYKLVIKADGKTYSWQTDLDVNPETELERARQLVSIFDQIQHLQCSYQAYEFVVEKDPGIYAENFLEYMEDCDEMDCITYESNYD